MQADERQGMLTPSAALTIAATLLGGATEQTIRYFTRRERELYEPNDGVNAGDDVGERQVPAHIDADTRVTRVQARPPGTV